MHARIRRFARSLGVSLGALALLATAQAEAAATRSCPSADLRYPFREGGRNDFGVFRLQVTGGSCTTARRVAGTWMSRFEGDLADGRIRLRRTVEGYRFTTLPPNAPQTYRLRGRKTLTSIRFDYVVPNG
jgi:hypothetical protein